MWGEMGWCGTVECWDGGVARHGEGGVSRDVGCVDSSNLPTKKIGAPSNYPGARLFISPPHQTKSNPDMRNSKLAHTQAGF